MSNKRNSNKVRVDFRKNRSERTRISDWTRQYEDHGFEENDPVLDERISGKGELTKRRTLIAAEETAESSEYVLPEVDIEQCIPGRVLKVHGQNSLVEDPQGRIFNCFTRRILRTLSTEQRHVVIAGDRVLFRDAEQPNRLEGIIERVETRTGIIARTSRKKQHIIVANVDQAIIVSSAKEPILKPNLIDRMLISSESSNIRPIICINKIDLVSPASLQPLIGLYSQMGYTLIPVSATTGFGIERLKKLLRDKESVITGQSGVGKSSLLNAIDPGLELRVAEISRDTQKGRHTTTTAELIKLSFGGYVVDTPGIRQFMLWDVIPEEVFGYFKDLRPYENFCRYPDCTHTFEDGCAVKNAVGDGRLDLRRYESYISIRSGPAE